MPPLLNRSESHRCDLFPSYRSCRSLEDLIHNSYILVLILLRVYLVEWSALIVLPLVCLSTLSSPLEESCTIGSDYVRYSGLVLYHNTDNGVPLKSSFCRPVVCGAWTFWWSAFEYIYCRVWYFYDFASWWIGMFENPNHTCLRGITLPLLASDTCVALFRTYTEYIDH